MTMKIICLIEKIKLVTVRTWCGERGKNILRGRASIRKHNSICRPVNIYLYREQQVSIYHGT